MKSIKKILICSSFLFLICCNGQDKNPGTNLDKKNETNINLLKKEWRNQEYEIIKQQVSDINQDKVNDRIYVLWNKKENIFLTYVLFLDKNSRIIKTFKNKNILLIVPQNSTGTGLQTITCKNNYFTFEDNITEGNPTKTQYITFVYSKTNNQIYLHKYGIIVMYDDSNSSKDWEKVYSSKNFGNIKFEDVTTDFLLNLRQK